MPSVVPIDLNVRPAHRSATTLRRCSTWSTLWLLAPGTSTPHCPNRTLIPALCHLVLDRSTEPSCSRRRGQLSNPQRTHTQRGWRASCASFPSGKRSETKRFAHFTDAPDALFANPVILGTYRASSTSCAVDACLTRVTRSPDLHYERVCVVGEDVIGQLGRCAPIGPVDRSPGQAGPNLFACESKRA